jgi:hypothetical protein
MRSTSCCTRTTSTDARAAAVRKPPALRAPIYERACVDVGWRTASVLRCRGADGVEAWSLSRVLFQPRTK